MATDKNILKNWFKTGLKPTQSQFWAWLDSFWHKDEKIPISSIEGIDTALENKAEASALDGKANADSSGLTAENILQWKETLGVGEVPDNMATIDKDGEQGNAYTKEQVDDLLENSGKNLGNTDLKIPENTVRVLDTTNAKFQIKGLENKKSDASYNLRPKIDANGNLGFTDEADININIPDTITTTATPVNSTITVNHIYPNQVPQLPQYVEEIRNIMATYRNIDFIPIRREDYRIVSNNNEVSLESVMDENGYFTLNKKKNEKIISNITLPSDKNWMVEFNGTSIKYNNSAGNLFGISRKGDNEMIYTIYITENEGYYYILRGNNRVSIAGFVKFLFVKTGNLLTIIGYGEAGFCNQYTFNMNTELSDFEVMVQTSQSKGLRGSFKYKIFE